MGREYLMRFIFKSWRKETSADPDNWSQGNPAWGQCAVTALTVQDFLGGQLVRMDLTKHQNPAVAAMRSHYFNLLNGEEFDFSGGQFVDNLGEFTKIKAEQTLVVKERAYLLQNESTRSRYLLLRLEVARRLADDNPLFDNEIYRKCLSSALLSNCQKGRYGCVVTHNGQVIAETQNQIIEPLREWC